jgi:zinc transport system permease protein
MIDFMLYALAAGLMIAVTAGALGTFVVWQRLAYFGDTLAHSALLGVALSLWLAIDPRLAIIGSCLALAGLLVFLQRRPGLATDSLLGILSHGSLAIGLVAVALMDNMRLDLNAYLFGDLLAVSQSDLVIIGSVCSLIISLLVWRWNALLNITVHAELAAVEGFAVAKLRLLLMLLIALLVAVAMKVVGVLLITALLIIPAATARKLARSPEQMAVGAVVIGVVAVAGGLYLSMTADTPAGPSIVVIATALFALLSPWRKQA